jgi:hypothetical protein
VTDQRTHLLDAMARAVEACQQALVDYQTGLLDEDQLRRALYVDGVVLGQGEAWLLDVAAGRWQRYDGIGTEALPMDGEPRAPSPRAFDAATLRRWQEGLRALLRAGETG